MTKEVISDQLMYQIKKYEAQGHSRLETVQEFHLDYKAIRLLELKTRIDELKKTKWNDYAFPERARVLINEGFPKQQISRELGINLSTICYWEKNNFKLRGKKRSEGGSNKLPFGDKYFHFLNCLSKINAGETHKQCLERELKEELQVAMTGMRFFDSYSARHFQEQGTIIHMDVYSVEIAGEPKPSSEIEQIAWITSSSYKINGLQLGSIVE